jgi:replicative DNA helicase
MGAVSALPIPPHSVDAEQALLGAILIDPRAFSRVAIQPEDFYRAEHGLIFSAMAEIVPRGMPDAVMVANVLRHRGQLEAVGGVEYLAQLHSEATSAANIQAYARIVLEKRTERRLREVGAGIVGRAEAGQQKPDEQIGEAMRELLAIAETARAGKGLVTAKELVRELLDDLDRRRDGAQGLSVGLPDFDALSNGLEAGDLVVIAGRPGMGKTALLVSIAAHVSKSAGVAVFSAEMSSQQLMRRCVSLLGSVSQGRLRRASEIQDADWDAIGAATGQLAERRLWIDDKPLPTLNHVRSEVLSLKAKAGLGLVLVDYVQLIQGAGANRYEQLRDVAYGLKGLAKEAGVPVILLAQLNRGVETRGENKRGRLSDLRDSGAIEEAADIVGMLYSEGYYDPGHSMAYVLECAIEKNRNGERGECLWYFAGEFSRVATLQDGAREQYRKMRNAARKPQGDDL